MVDKHRPHGAPQVLLIDCHYQPKVVTDHYYVTAAMEPLGLEYLHGFLLEHGFSCETIRWPEQDIPVYDQGAPQIVGISGLTYSYAEMRRAARQARHLYPQALVVAGREHASAMPEQVLLDPNFDAVVVGEGELSLLALARGSPLSEVPSLVWRDSRSTIVHNHLARALPGERWVRPVRYPRWMRNMLQESRTRYSMQAGIMLGRGCVFRCEFCTAPMMWGKYRTGDPVGVVREIERVRCNYGVRYFAFHDLMINGNPPALHSLLRDVAHRGLDVEFFGMASVSRAHLDFSLLRRGGLRELGIGVELPSSARKALGKGLGIDAVYDFLGAAKAAGIFIRCYLIIGWPWETDEIATAEHYLAFLRACPVNAVRVHFLTPFPGTLDWQKYRSAIRWRELEEHFHRFTTMEPVLRFHLLPEELIAVRRRIIEGYYTSEAYSRLRADQRKDAVLDEMNTSFCEWVAKGSPSAALAAQTQMMITENDQMKASESLAHRP